MTDEELIAMARAARVDDRLSDGALYGRLADRLQVLIDDRDSAHRVGLLAQFEVDWLTSLLAEAREHIEDAVADAENEWAGSKNYPTREPRYRQVYEDLRDLLARIDGHLKERTP